MFPRRKKLLLIAADDDLARAIVQGFAVGPGTPYEVVPAASLTVAAQMLEVEAFDALLFDLAAAAGGGQVTLLDHKAPVLTFFSGAESAGRYQPGSPALTELQDAVAAALGSHAGNVRTLRRALYDEFTGLPTGALLLDLVNQAVARAQRSGLHVAFAPMTLNGLQSLETEVGAERAEIIYKSILLRLTSSLRSSDVVAALGGANFGLLLELRHGFEDAVLVTERLREIMSGHFTFGSVSLDVDLTLRGPLMCDHQVESLEELLDLVDAAPDGLESLSAA